MIWFSAESAKAMVIDLAVACAAAAALIAGTVWITGAFFA